MAGVGAAIAALEQALGVLVAQPRAGIGHLHPIRQQAHHHLALRGVLDRVADQVAQRHRQRRLRCIDHPPGRAFQAQFQRLAAELGAVRVEQLLGHLGHVTAALAALVARQQQQRADQVAALLLGALDAQQPGAGAFIQLRAREQQLHRAFDHRQRRAQFMADVGVELAVALHHFGQPQRIGVQRLGQLPDLVVGKVGGQRLGMAAAAIGAQARGQFGHRLHHPRRRPPADQQRKRTEQQDRGQQHALELDLAAGGLAHVVGQEEPGLGRLAHRQLVGELPALLVDGGDGVVAGGQVVPLRVFLAHVVEAVGREHEGADLLHRQLGAARGIERVQACVLVDIAVHHVLDQLVLHPLARVVGEEREQGRQARAQQQEREDDAGAQPPAQPPRAAPCRGHALSCRHRGRRCGSRSRAGSGCRAPGRACRSRRAGRGYARAGNRNRAAPRPRPGSPAPAG